MNNITPDWGYIRTSVINCLSVRKTISNKRLARLIREQENYYDSYSDKSIIKIFYKKITPELSLFKGVRNKNVASNKFLASFEWRKVRMVALKANNGCCECCGQDKSDGIKLHVDHIKPRKTYPELALDPNNLQVLCNECNHGKGNWDTTDWR